MSQSTPEFRPTDGGVGAFVENIDLNAPFANSLGPTLCEALGEYGVLFFRDQTITPERHLAFAEHIGSIDVNRFFQPVPDHPRIAEVRKEPQHKLAIGERWHTDHSYDNAPALGSILVARELPSSGGATMFANMFAAYEALSDGLKMTLDSLEAEHSSRGPFGAPRSPEMAKELEGRLGNQEAAVQDAIHPVVIRHPVSGRKALYVNRAFTTRFVGWTEAESVPLLEYLYEFAAQPEFVYRFDWEPGSIAFWDNRAVWHRALNDYQGERRLMHRITLEGVALSA